MSANESKRRSAEESAGFGSEGSDDTTSRKRKPSPARKDESSTRENCLMRLKLFPTRSRSRGIWIVALLFLAEVLLKEEEVQCLVAVPSTPLFGSEPSSRSRASRLPLRLTIFVTPPLALASNKIQTKPVFILPHWLLGNYLRDNGASTMDCDTTCPNPLTTRTTTEEAANVNVPTVCMLTRITARLFAP